MVITWLLGVGQARDGAALGWTDASPKRNHRISSTKEERREEERKGKGLKAGGGRRRRRRRLTAKEGGKAWCAPVRFEERSEGNNSHPNNNTNTMHNREVNRKTQIYIEICSNPRT